MKLDFDKLDIGKLETTLVHLSKISVVVENNVVKKTEYDELVKNVNAIKRTNTSDLVKTVTTTKKLVKCKR